MENAMTLSALKQQLIANLEKAQAHITFEDAVKNIRPENFGKTVKPLPYTLWQLVEHLRIAQNDILEFCRNPNYKERNWPDDYWPKNTTPKNKADWDKAILTVENDRNAFIELLHHTDDIFTPLPQGNGQNLLREALLIADHNAYHVGQIMLLRRLVGDY